MQPRQRVLLIAAGLFVAGWVIAIAGFYIARNSKTTAAKVQSYLQQKDLSALQGEDRRKALARLASMLNQLPPEERRRARADRLWSGWFAEMTEQEKGEFIDATMPTGFKQMLASFEELPEPKRRKAVEDSLRRWKEARDQSSLGRGEILTGDTNQPPLSPELRQKIITSGLKSFYAESSAQTKAELAPLLEEMQRAMESGALFRRP